MRIYLIALLVLLALSPSLVFADNAGDGPSRLTFYTDYGVMRDGNITYVGAASCGHDFPLGTVLQLPSGMIVTCEDRGAFEPAGVDVYAPTWDWGYENVELPMGYWIWPVVLAWGTLPN